LRIVAVAVVVVIATSQLQTAPHATTTTTTTTTTAAEKTLRTMAAAPPPTTVEAVVVPPRAGCGAPVAVFAVAVRDRPPVAVGHAVAIAVRRPLLLLLHRCRRCCRLTIDAGNAVAYGGTGLAPPASAAVVAIIHHHRRVDGIEPLHPHQVGRGGNQYCFPLPPPLPLAAT
jgi:hypothetical protein